MIRSAFPRALRPPPKAMAAGGSYSSEALCICGKKKVTVTKSFGRQMLAKGDTRSFSKAKRGGSPDNRIKDNQYLTGCESNNLNSYYVSGYTWFLRNATDVPVTTNITT